MIDIHSHLLFGLDDGAQTPDDMLAMARQAVSNGITDILVTPHHNDGVYLNPPERIAQRMEEAQSLIDQQQIPLRLGLGMEIHIYGEVVEDLKNGKLVTYHQKDRHILLELPHDHVPRYAKRLIFDLQLAGYIPIIPHPERNAQMREDPNLLYELVKQGALAQLTAASVAGKFGKKIQKCCFDMIKHHLIQFIASDAHNTSSRGFVLKEAYQVVQDKFGPDYVELFAESAQAVLNGKDGYMVTPERIRKKLWGIF